MSKKSMLLVFLMCFLAVGPCFASELGILGGFGPYWVEDDVFWGYALTGFVDVLIQNFKISPMLGFWSGNIHSERLIDVSAAVAFKYPFAGRDAKLQPYIGFAPVLHLWFAQGQSDMHFGADAFAGVAIMISKNTQIPLQLDYGFIFVEGTTVNKFTAKVGIATRM
ncbi:MAG: hypothetical protein OEV79_09305 [candidate division WOR-3 bacterium]|nr:hypothetical protein [candidate division WOR-3 bacterium]